MGERDVGSANLPAPPAQRGAGPDSLESFVALLHGEGVEAGRIEAARIVRDAENDAEQILRRAREEADRLVSLSRERAQEDRERSEAELRLAIRDALLGLRAALESALERVLFRAVEEPLRDATFLRALMVEVVAAYAADDAAGHPAVEFKVPPGLRTELEQWALSELGRRLRNGDEDEDALSDIIYDAGFEYMVSGGTVEVTVPAAVEKLMELVTPRLRTLVGTAGDGAA